MELPKNLLLSEIRRGTVLFSESFRKTNIGHGKFFVVIGVSCDFVAGCFFINSGVNTACMKKQEQLELQFPIEPDEYDFLDHRSYINATNIIELKKSVLADDLDKGVASLKGEIESGLMDRILDKCRNSRLFSKQEKDIYMY